MSKFECTLNVELPLYDVLKSGESFGRNAENKLEETDSGVRITILTDEISTLMAATNYWLRLIKASSSVFQVI